MKKIIVLFLLTPLLVAGQTISQKADELLTAYATQSKFSGNVLIAKEGTVVFQKAYGYADLENKKPNTLQTEFRVGSLTKTFTSSVILQLVEASKLSLTDPISKFIPDFPNGGKIQINHLLSHTSGIKSFTALPDYGSWCIQPSTLQETINRFKNLPLEFNPGERFDYSNSNYVLLSYIAEKVSKTNFPTLLQNKVFRKANMLHSGLDATGRPSDNKALGYVFSSKGYWEQARPIHIEMPSGAGGAYTTLEDLYKWSRVLSSNTVLSQASLKKAFTPVQGEYGLGWVVKTVNGRTELSHPGAIDGFIANFMHYPKEDITIIWLSNYGGINGRQLNHDLTALVFNEPYTLPTPKQEVSLAQDALQKYVGVYELNEHFSITVSVENNKLYALAKGDAEKTELSPESETKFFIKGPQIEVEFIVENGKVQYMFVKHQGGVKLTKIS